MEIFQFLKKIKRSYQLTELLVTCFLWNLNRAHTVYKFLFFFAIFSFFSIIYSLYIGKYSFYILNSALWWTNFAMATPLIKTYLVFLFCSFLFIYHWYWPDLLCGSTVIQIRFLTQSIIHTHCLILFVYVAGLGQLHIPCAQLSCGGELDSVLGAGDHDSVTDLWQVAADTGKLPRGHLHHTTVLLLLERTTEGQRSGTVWMKSTFDAKHKEKPDIYLLEYPAAPRPGPSISSHNLTPSPDLLVKR